MSETTGRDSSKESMPTSTGLSENVSNVSMPAAAPVTTGKRSRPVVCRLRDTTVLLIALEGLVKDLLYLLINDKCGEVRDISSAVKGLELFEKRKFDLVVVDDGLPDLNRARFLADIRKINPETAVALVGTKGDGAALDPEVIRADALIGIPLDMDRLPSMFYMAIHGRRGIR
jgi:DNA-binding NtrC family response regulator